MDYLKVAKNILPEIGGANNVVKAVNCMTRIRIELADKTKANAAALKNIDGVLGVVEGDILQVIVGPGASEKVTKELNGLLAVEKGAVNRQEGTQEELKAIAAKNKAERTKKTKVSDLLKNFSNIFVPLIPALIGAGITAGVASIIQNLLTAGDIAPGGFLTTAYGVMTVINKGLMAYLSIFVGINSAKVFGASEGLGGIIGGTTLLTGMLPAIPKNGILGATDFIIHNIFTGDALKAGQGGILGVILAVWILSLAEKSLKKITPDVIQIIVVPVFSLIITGIITLCLVMPLAGLVSSRLVYFVNWLLALKIKAVVGFLLAALFLPMVMLGLHQILTPIHLELINTTGSTYLLPILAMAGAGQVGAVIALWIKKRKTDKKLCNMIKGALPAGILGIGEPLIYGVTLPLGRPFITACLGGGIGGAVVAAFGNVGALAIGPSGIDLIPLITGGWYKYVIGLLAAYLAGFVFTMLFGLTENNEGNLDNI